MFGTSLDRAVEKLAEVAQDLREPDLEREWAWGAYDSEGVRFACFRTYEELRELAAKLAHERMSQGAPVSEAQRILAQYHAAFRDLHASLLSVEGDIENQPPSDGEWPVSKVVAHVVGADIGFYVAIQYALDLHRQGHGNPEKIPDEAWEAVLGEDITSVETTLEGPLPGVQAYHQVLHQRILTEFSGISAGELDVPSIYWEGYELSLRFRLHRLDSHARQHTVQVDKILTANGHGPSEAGRLVRLIYAALAQAEGAAIGDWHVGQDLSRQVAAEVAARTEEIRRILD